MCSGRSGARQRRGFTGHARCRCTKPRPRRISSRSARAASSKWGSTGCSRKRVPNRFGSSMTAADAGVEEPAPAKINLALHVTGQRADGYHLLDSLVAFADAGDRVTVRPAARTFLHVTGPMADGVPAGAENAVLRAAALIGVGAGITLDKHLPAAAGIGGGSSDAAATLRALARLAGIAVPGDVLPLGADVPVCLLARVARMRGIGEVVEPVEG